MSFSVHWILQNHILCGDPKNDLVYLGQDVDLLPEVGFDENTGGVNNIHTMTFKQEVTSFIFDYILHDLNNSDQGPIMF